GWSARPCPMPRKAPSRESPDSSGSATSSTPRATRSRSPTRNPPASTVAPANSRPTPRGVNALSGLTSFRGGAAGARPGLGSARRRDRQPGHQVGDDLLGGALLHPGLGGEQQPVREDRDGERLDVVGDDVAAPLQGGVGARGADQVQGGAGGGAQPEQGRGAGGGDQVDH